MLEKDFKTIEINVIWVTYRISTTIDVAIYPIEFFFIIFGSIYVPILNLTGVDLISGVSIGYDNLKVYNGIFNNNYV